MEKNRDYFFQIKNNKLNEIFNDLTELGVYQGDQHPVKIVPYTETSANIAFLQVQTGCHHNSCTFCPFYKNIKYSEKSEKEIFSNIDIISSYYKEKNIPISRIMLLDADALVYDQKKIVRILQYIDKNFQKNHAKKTRTLDWDATQECFFNDPIVSYKTPIEIGSFIHTDTILEKGAEELKQLHQSGLQLLWWGVESGHFELLKRVKKVNSNVQSDLDYSQRIIKAGQILDSVGIFYVVLILVGVGGEIYYSEHLQETKKLLERLQPPGLALSSLVIYSGTTYADQVSKGEFDILAPQRLSLQRQELESAVPDDTIQFSYELKTEKF